MPQGSSTGNFHQHDPGTAAHSLSGEPSARAGTPAVSHGGPFRAPEPTGRGIGELVLGLRLLALAVVAGSGTLLPIGSSSRPQLLAGIIAGAALGVAQYLALRTRLRAVGEALILAHVAAWTWLVHVSGHQHSPLFVGYVLEVALSGAAFYRRGCLLASLGSFAAYVLEARRYDHPLDPSTIATVGGFLAIGTLLTWILIEAIERQRRRLDIYHRALQERADTISEELRLLGDYLSGALVGLDGLGRVASINPACAQLLGVETGRVLGRAWQELIQADEHGTSAIVDTLSDGTPHRGVRMLVRRSDGREIPVEAELWVSPSPEGRRAYLLLGEIQSATAGGDPLRRLGEAAACVAHQIKNSLHALQGYAAELQREAGEGSAERDNLDHLLKVVRSLGALSEDVLAMAGAARPPEERVQIGEVLSSAALLTRHAPGGVALEIPGEELSVRAHRGQLVHAFFNLLDNACRVTPPGERVQVHVSRGADRVTVEIADHGPGLPPELASGRGPVASREGSGYGLLAARRFIEDNGGGLTFHPGDDGGTVCCVEFPPCPTPLSARGRT